MRLESPHCSFFVVFSKFFVVAALCWQCPYLRVLFILWILIDVCVHVYVRLLAYTVDCWTTMVWTVRVHLYMQFFSQTRFENTVFMECETLMYWWLSFRIHGSYRAKCGTWVCKDFGLLGVLKPISQLYWGTTVTLLCYMR